MHNLQNTVIDEITIKRLLRLKSRNTEVSLRLTIPRIHRALHRKPSTRKSYLTTLHKK